VGSVGFTHGAVYRRDQLYIAAVDMELEEQDVYHGYVLRWKKGAWGQWSVANRIYALGVFDLVGGCTSFAMGPDGRIQVGDDRGFRWETIDTGEGHPTQQRPLTCLRKVANSIYAAGMSRMVYRRLSEGQWARIDQGVRVSRTSVEVTGFLAIDGFDEGELYAVGFHGQMWSYDGVAWRRLDGPTNLKLECVRCTELGEVFIAGSNGLILRGRNDAWEIVEQDQTRETFWGMEYAFGALYLSTAAGEIYRLSGNEFSRVVIDVGRPIGTRTLHYADNTLLSVGAHDLCVFDGRVWTRLSHPE
jgi:hypothetical protein